MSAKSPALVTGFDPRRIRFPLAPARERLGGSISAGMISTVHIAVAVPSAKVGEHLPAGLRAFARIADNFDDMLSDVLSRTRALLHPVFGYGVHRPPCVLF